MMHIKITKKMHQELKNHLHNGDGLEALAFALCGRLSNNDDDFLLVHKVFLMPYNKCERSEVFVFWKTIDIEHLMEEAESKGLAIVKLHSHFVLDSDFSSLDDISDKSFFDSVYGWTDNDLPHASVIMYGDGSMKGRLVKRNLKFQDVHKFSIIGESIEVFSNTLKSVPTDKAFDRNAQAFGQKTVSSLKEMKIGVVGCSGTGSPLIEMLVRLGVGKLVLVDPDVMGVENLNRIYGSTMGDAISKRPKVDVIEEHIKSINIGTEVVSYNCILQESREVINELASCDFLFGCVDSFEGRHYLNYISTYYLVPLIDIGVKLSADGKGGIESIVGSIHYIFPNSKTLLERGVYTSELLLAESLKRLSPQEFEKRQDYFDNIEVSSPAVISINTTCSSTAINEMLGRIHEYRYSKNQKFSNTVINFTEWDLVVYPNGDTEDRLHYENIGIGDLKTIL